MLDERESVGDVLAMREYEWTVGAIPCPACFTPLADIAPGKRATCRQCALSLTYDELDEALQFAYEAATYGYLYPKVEGRANAQQHQERYSLVTDPYLVWLALAALSGIVGNLSYDIIKAAMCRLLGKKKGIPVISQGKTSLETREIHIGKEFEMNIPVNDSEFDMIISSVASYIAKCRQELADGSFDPPTSRDEFVRMLLNAQEQPGWKRERRSKEQLAADYDSFRTYYARERKRSMDRVEICQETLLRIGAQMEKGTKSSITPSIKTDVGDA